MKQIDLTNQTFGRLTAKKYTQNKWLCVCSCGSSKLVTSYSLRKGITQSCGCLHSEVVIARNTIHAAHGTKAYRIWTNMKDRCTNPNNKAYHRYGGRGITVCERWLKFDNFLADMGQPIENLTLDRIDNNKGYSPRNCKWSTCMEQARNRHTTIVLTAFGETKSLMEWIDDERCNAKRDAIVQRIRTLGWGTEKAITTSPRGKSNKHTS